MRVNTRLVDVINEVIRMSWLKQVWHQVNQFFQYGIIKILQMRAGEKSCSERNLKRVQDMPLSILVIRLDEIGDMVMMSPFLRELRRNYPSAYITLVVNPIVYNMVELCPYVDNVLCFSRGEGRLFFYLNLWRIFLFSHRYFRNENYDLAFVPRFDADYPYGAGILAFCSRAKKRIGYSESVLSHKRVSDRRYDGFYTNSLSPKAAVVFHEVERNLDILRYMGADVIDDTLEMWFNDNDQARAQARLPSLEDGDVRIALSISAGSPKREWPVENFIELIKLIARFKKIEWIIVGAGERAVASSRKIEKECPYVINLVNQNSLRETAAVINLCAMYLGGDTGLMHIAAALGKPGIVISCHPLGADEDHANSPQRFGPWKSSMQIMRPKALHGCEHGCNWEEAHCIRGICIEDVKRKVLALL